MKLNEQQFNEAIQYLEENYNFPNEKYSIQVLKRTPDHIKLGFYVDKKLIGDAELSTYKGKKYSHIDNFGFKKSERSKGYGKIFFEFLINTFDCRFLEVDVGHEIAIHLYKKFGFEIDRETKDSYGTKIYEMSRKLVKKSILPKDKIGFKETEKVKLDNDKIAIRMELENTLKEAIEYLEEGIEQGSLTPTKKILELDKLFTKIFSDYKYGFLKDNKPVKYSDYDSDKEFWDDFFKYNKFKSVEDSIKTKHVVCTEVVEIIADYFEKENIPYKKWLMLSKDGSPHCVITGEIDGFVVKYDFTPQGREHWKPFRTKVFKSESDFIEVRKNKGKRTYMYNGYNIVGKKPKVFVDEVKKEYIAEAIEYLEESQKQAMIISGFAGTGANHAKEKLREKGYIIDTIDKYSDFYKIYPTDIDYINDIKNRVKKCDYLFIPYFLNMNDRYLKDKVDFLLVYPKKELKALYLKRFKDLGFTNNQIQNFIDNWDDMITDCSTNYKNSIAIGKNEYLLYVLEKRKLTEATQYLEESLKSVKESLPNVETGSAFKVKFYDKGVFVGEASVSDDYNGNRLCFIYNVEVPEKLRGKGYGTKIMKYMINNYHVKSLQVEPGNDVAIHLYKKLGFKETGRVRMGKNRVDIRMERGGK